MLRLSKSRYISEVWKCPKASWLKKYKPEEEAPFDSAAQAVMDTGNDIGDLAMGLFGDFVEVTEFDHDENGEKAGLDLGAMIRLTKEEMQKGTPVICEASFSTGSNFCSVDILKKEDSGWAIYEVKSSTSLKDEYLADIAYQKYVLEKCGVALTGTYLVVIDNSYVLDGDFDIQKFFKIIDVSGDIEEEYNNVEPNIAVAEKMAASDKEPDHPCGLYCFNPHECRFRGYCMANLPSPSVFDLYSISKKDALKLYNEGKADLKTIYENEDIVRNVINKTGSSAGETRERQLAHHAKDLPPHVDKDGIRSFADTVTYPLYFLDFETMTPVVPVYQGTKSRQQIPFQYSLHYMEEQDGDVKHKEFLAESGPDPRRAVAESLCRDIPRGVCTMVFSKSMESGRLKELAALFPDLSNHLLDINKGIVDLNDPFKAGYYYERSMTPPPKGVSLFSIKNVLPSMFPDDPELDYHKLEGVQNGEEAKEVFPKIQFMEPEEQERTRQGLLDYCRLDTLAMVKIWQKLKHIIDE